jgi:hypothetical protein
MPAVPDTNIVLWVNTWMRNGVVIEDTASTEKKHITSVRWVAREKYMYVFMPIED